MDLASAQFRDVLAKRIQRKRFRAAMVALPCATLSRARQPQLRANANLWGLPGLSPQDQQQLRHANQMIRNTLILLRLLTALRAPWILENPQTSLIWRFGGVKALARHRHARKVILDQCMWGSPWRKGTTLLCYRAPALWQRLLRRRCRCCGGVCERTGVPHVWLRGRLGKKAKTELAAQYPRGLARALAAALLAASAQ